MGNALKTMEAFGVSTIVDLIYDGHSMTAIAEKMGVGKASLSEWISSNPERSARVNAARADSAEHWDRLAEKELRSATSSEEIAVARELAHHFRWRASKIAPKIYGDAAPTVNIQVNNNTLAQLPDAELLRIVEQEDVGG